MKILLDSCAFVDLAVNANTLIPSALAKYYDRENEIYLSVASVWELGLKQSRGKLNFDVTKAVELSIQQGITLLDITLPVILLVNQLPYYHKDPFDRVIIASAKIHNLSVMTSDAVFTEYGLRVFNSRAAG